MNQQPTQKISVLIVDDIPETRENLQKLLYFESDIEIVGTAENGQQAIDHARRLQPDIVLMDINMPDMDGITASQEIVRLTPASQIIMMSVQSEADYLRRSMLAGAMDFLTKPFTSEELSSSIHRVYETGVNRRPPGSARHETEEGTPTTAGTAAFQPSSEGKLLLIYSPKGGTGCSTLATNLAIAMAQTTSKKVALVDASLQFGDADVLLNLQGNQSIVDAMKRMDELDSDLLTVLMSSHPSGVKVLAAPPNPVDFDTIGTEVYKKVLERVQKAFDYVVLDTWSYLDDTVLAAIDLAERILIVMTPEIPSIKSTKQFFEIAEALEFPLDRVDLILNKVYPRDEIRADQIENSMKHKIRAQFEFEPQAVRQAVNQGLPVITAQPNHPLSQGFLDLAHQEVASMEPQPAEAAVEEAPPQAERPRRSGLFGRLKK
jgi:pilus assembly protein CpaE